MRSRFVDHLIFAACIILFVNSTLTSFQPNAAFYKSSIEPLVFICMVLLPLAYIVGLIFSLKTHRGHIYDTFTAEVGEDGKRYMSKILNFQILMWSYP